MIPYNKIGHELKDSHSYFENRFSTTQPSRPNINSFDSQLEQSIKFKFLKF